MFFVICRLLARTVHKDDLARVATEMVEGARGDEGCLSIDLFGNCALPNEFLILSRWADRPAVDRHFATPHVQRFVERFPGLVEIRPVIEVHEVSSSRKI